MKSTLNPLPDLPAEIENAALSGELVVFVGAGISRLIKCPSWQDFANQVLEQLAPNGIDYYDLSQIGSIADPKKRLSLALIVAEKKKLEIDYTAIFQVKPEKNNVYSYLNTFNSSFVTTNYEKYLCPESRKTDPEGNWRFYKREHLLGVNLDRNGNVVHLHGCIDDPKTMIITTKDYLDHYLTTQVQDFLRSLFERKTVLFLGYGLEETEVLEYVLRRGGASGNERSRLRRFILQGFFQAEVGLCDLLSEYYRDSFSTDLIGFPKDYKSHGQQTEILAAWSRKLSFGSMALTDEAAALEDEISG